MVSIGNSDAVPHVDHPVGRALVPVTPLPVDSGHAPAPANLRANVPFLTQLIATADGHPQTRARRRADPNWATNAYAAMMQIPAVSGQAVHESR